MKDLNEFIDTGRFIPRNFFQEKRPNEVLLEDCSDLVEYEGGHYIQVLDDGTFYLDVETQNKKLEEVELVLHSRIINQLEDKNESI